MSRHETTSPEFLSRCRLLILAGGLALTLLPLWVGAQDATSFEQDFAGSIDTTPLPATPSLWDLAIEGGWFMIPIGLASIVTVAFTLERMIGLRQSRILPRQMILDLQTLTSHSVIDPRKAWKVCQDHASPLANVLRVAVLKTGRPHPEIEKAVEDAVDRETATMTRNLRPINVVASIAPLLGLLGTVQGMILAFMVTSTTTSTGTAKAQELAHGIYTALVTTFAGLFVAVVSVILVNYLEGRVERLLHHMEEIFLELLPQLERFEGRLRVSKGTAEEDSVDLLKTRSQNGTPEFVKSPPPMSEVKTGKPA